MPPKKAGKGKKDGPAKVADKENLARAEVEVLSLQKILELRSHEVGLQYAFIIHCIPLRHTQHKLYAIRMACVDMNLKCYNLHNK